MIEKERKGYISLLSFSLPGYECAEIDYRKKIVELSLSFGVSPRFGNRHELPANLRVQGNLGKAESEGRVL